MRPILTLLVLTCLTYCSEAKYSKRPVIGILTQEFCPPSNLWKFYTHKSYIAACYVKAVEASGAMVVPIQIGQSEAYYEQKMSHINGLLIPGGAAAFNNTKGYKDAGATLIRIAERMNSQGDEFPILGICLGFELLMFVSNKEKELREKCNCFHMNYNLTFEAKARRKGIYKMFDNKQIKALEKQGFTYNYHIWCITKYHMTQTGLDKSWNILTQSGNTFISSVQSKKYPFVGIQFHPEKNAFEWNSKSHYVHSRMSIETNRIYYDWLVMKANENTHTYPSENDLYRDVIYNYAPVMTYPKTEEVGFEQLYFFD